MRCSQETHLFTLDVRVDLLALVHDIFLALPLRFNPALNLLNGGLDLLGLVEANLLLRWQVAQHGFPAEDQS